MSPNTPFILLFAVGVIFGLILLVTSAITVKYFIDNLDTLMKTIATRSPCPAPTADEQTQIDALRQGRNAAAVGVTFSVLLIVCSIVLVIMKATKAGEMASTAMRSFLQTPSALKSE